MTSQFPTPGDVFEDTYRIEAILGSGGFARVYRAVEVGLERPVALKILRPPKRSDQTDSQRDDYLDTVMERFQREALMLSKLRSSYTVNLYKYGKTDAGLLYMALEYIDGLSLQEILRARKPLQPKRVVKILQQVLMSLQEAHALGMLHRDLKPANIMVYEHLGEKDHVKLLDFGIAKLVTEADTDQDLTSDGTLIGTPRYMSPEQIQGQDIGPPADIYALGLVCYELLTGERAIQGDSSIQIIGKQLAPQSFQLPDDDRIPPGVRFVINKMMAKEIDYRYVDCEAVLTDLARPSLLKTEEELSSEDIPQLDLVEPLDEIDGGDVEALDESQERDIDDERDEDAKLTDDDLIAVMTTRENLIYEDKRRERAVRVVGILFVLALVIGGVVMLAQPDEDPAPEPDRNAVANKTPETVAPEDALKVTEKEEPEIQVTARLDGQAIEGVTVYVDGVEKGVTPLTLKAEEIRDASVVASYKMPDRDEPIEDTQEVTDPRDVLFEFDKVVSELITPADPGTDTPPKVDEVKPKPKPKPRRHYKRRKPKPKPKIDELYPAPE